MERSGSPELLPIFRSRQQVELLADILDEPDREQSLAELTRRLGIPTASIHREIERAERAGVVRSRRVGKTRLVSAARWCLALEDLNRNRLGEVDWRLGIGDAGQGGPVNGHSAPRTIVGRDGSASRGESLHTLTSPGVRPDPCAADGRPQGHRWEEDLCGAGGE